MALRQAHLLRVCLACAKLIVSHVNIILKNLEECEMEASYALSDCYNRFYVKATKNDKLP